MEKITTREELALMRGVWKKEGKKVGFTSGAFDLIHAGHVAYLEEAKKKCDILIVALNSDLSVRKCKGEDRPIVNEKERIKLIAALESVDYVFMFDEKRNKENMEILKPDLYIKGADRKKSELLSADFVESYGGKVELIPISYNVSSSVIIEKIFNIFGKDKKETVTVGGATHIPIKYTKKNVAIFLDRDGTINEDTDYVGEPERFKLLPNVIEGLKKIQSIGYKIVIITNQAGIGLGYFSKEDFYKVNRKMFELLAPHNIIIDKIYFCPHSKGDNCKCRKPNTALIERAAEELNLDIEGSYMIGDKTQDIELGKRFGCKTIKVKTGHQDNEFDVKPDYIAKDLLDAAEFISNK